jgi:hypothetical protein
VDSRAPDLTQYGTRFTQAYHRSRVKRGIGAPQRTPDRASAGKKNTDHMRAQYCTPREVLQARPELVLH